MALLYAISFVLFLAAVHNASALRCWSCSSELDITCMDHFNSTRLLQSNMYYNNLSPQYNGGNQYNPNGQYNNNNNNNNNNNQYPGNQQRRPSLDECRSYTGQLFNQQPVCMKRIEVMPGGLRITRRECKFISSQQTVGTCPYEPVSRGLSIEFCEYCNNDGCNSASGHKLNFIVASIVPIVLFLFFRK